MHAPDTGRESGSSERRTEAAVVTERIIMGDQRMTDLHMSVADLSVTAIVPHHMVCLVPKLLNYTLVELESN